MKDQLQKERQSFANKQYRAFMKVFAEYLSDPLTKKWVEKQAIHGTPFYIDQIDPGDSSISGYGAHYTRYIHKFLGVGFSLTFQAGIREMCGTEILCSYTIAESEVEFMENPQYAEHLPLEERDVFENNDPYLWQVWRTAEKMNLNGIQFVRKSYFQSKGRQNMEEMAECAAGMMNPMITIAINARNYIDRKL